VRHLRYLLALGGRIADAVRYERLDIFVAVADFAADPDERRTSALHSPIGKCTFSDAKNSGG